VACYLIVPDDPSAVSIRSHQWRIKVTSQQIKVTHGNIDQRILDDLTAEIKEQLSVKGLLGDPDNDQGQVEGFSESDNSPSANF
jgi:hypothetical protein